MKFQYSYYYVKYLSIFNQQLNGSGKLTVQIHLACVGSMHLDVLDL